MPPRATGSPTSRTHWLHSPSAVTLRCAHPPLSTQTTHSNQVHALSCLYETAPAYMTDQPRFLNAAAIVTTTLQPLDLLRELKAVEVSFLPPPLKNTKHILPSCTIQGFHTPSPQAGLGRQQGGPRNGPRPVDLDIIFYEGASLTLSDPDLTVPHASWQERPFVTAPLADLADCCEDDSAGWCALHTHLQHAQRVWYDEHAGTAVVSSLKCIFLLRTYCCCCHATPSLCVEPQNRTLRQTSRTRHTQNTTDAATSDTLQRVVPLSDGSLWRWEDRTWTMGIVNVTPDSFSDGGMHQHTDAAVQAALEMAEAGVDFLDVGGQSTRPGAALLSAEQEAARVLPVLRCGGC